MAGRFPVDLGISQVLCSLVFFSFLFLSPELISVFAMKERDPHTSFQLLLQLHPTCLKHTLLNTCSGPGVVDTSTWRKLDEPKMSAYCVRNVMGDREQRRKRAEGAGEVSWSRSCGLRSLLLPCPQLHPPSLLTQQLEGSFANQIRSLLGSKPSNGSQSHRVKAKVLQWSAGSVWPRSPAQDSVSHSLWNWVGPRANCSPKGWDHRWWVNIPTSLA